MVDATAAEEPDPVRYGGRGGGLCVRRVEVAGQAWRTAAARAPATPAPARPSTASASTPCAGDREGAGDDREPAGRWAPRSRAAARTVTATVVASTQPGRGPTAAPAMTPATTTRTIATPSGSGSRSLSPLAATGDGHQVLQEVEATVAASSHAPMKASSAAKSVWSES